MSRFIDNICPMVHTRCDRECGTCEECDKELKEMLADHDKQIRNEVVDEYTEVLRPMVSSLRSELQNNPHAFIDLDCIAYKLKGEQKK